VSGIQENTLHVIVTNVLGEHVIEFANPQTSTLSLDLSHLAAGIYYARFEMQNSVAIKKIVKE
jgi:hypothetical protein